MDFEKELTNYMKILNCSIKDISRESGISYSLVNRYINGKRTPKENGDNFDKLVEGLYAISINNNMNLTKESIYTTLKRALSGNSFQIDFDMFIDNLNKMLNELSISSAQLSKAIGYDSSFVSRIKNKERKPCDVKTFIEKVVTYIIYVVSQNEQKKYNIMKILKYPKSDIKDINSFKEYFTNWLCSKHIQSQTDDMLSFLSKLDNFDMNEYVGTDFSKVKIPTAPIIIRNSKSFFGIEGRKQAEGEFLKITLISKSKEPIFFYSDLPISETGNDEDFKKTWVFVMTRLLKKGLHLNMVHNLNRPINELLLGLENWLPIYMTGSISPYFFKEPPSNFFLGSHCTSGSVALSSECLKYNEKKSKYYLTTKKEELEYEKEKSKYMLSKATPLMKIYKEKDSAQFQEFIETAKNLNIQNIKKENFKNINFCLNENKWIIINKENSPQIHFVIYHEKLINAIKAFLLC